MTINPFIQTAFGAIIGGLVVIATNWLNTRREKRKGIQEWYEQRYVTECIDPLLTYFTNMIFMMHNNPPTSIGKPLLLPDAIVPVEAMMRLEVLLGLTGEVNGVEFLSVFILEANEAATSPVAQDDNIIMLLYEVCTLLHQLRQELLRLIPQEIKRKNQRLDLAEFGNNIITLIWRYHEKPDTLKREQEKII